MGADMLIATAPMEATRKEAMFNLAALSDEYLYGVVVDVTGDDELTIGEARERVIQSIREIVETRRHDVAWMTVGDAKLYVTGGLSWGDDPTDAFVELALLDATGVTEKKETV